GKGQQLGHWLTTGKVESLQASTTQYLNQNVIFGTGKQTAAVGANIISYSTPGVPILKGIGDYQASTYQRLFDVSVGILSVAPVVGEAAGLIRFSELGVPLTTGAKVLTNLGNPLVRTGLGAGISALGTVASGNTNLEDIGAAAVLGGALSYGTPFLLKGITGAYTKAFYDTQYRTYINLEGDIYTPRLPS